MKNQRKLSISALFINVFLALLVGFVVSQMVEVSPLLVAGGIYVTHLVLSFTVPTYMPKHTLGAKLQKEIWIDYVVKNLYPKNMFILDGVDFSAYVKNDKINFAIQGSDPDVLKNPQRSQYPLTPNFTNETPEEIELDYYITKPSVIQDAEQVELAYDKLAVATSGHRNKLATDMANDSIHNIAPVAETQHTLVVEATGHDATTNEPCVRYEDISKMKANWDDMDLPEDGRTIIMDSHEFEKFERNVPDALKKVIFTASSGDLTATVLKVCGFIIKNRKVPVVYSKNTLGKYQRQPFGTIAVTGDAKGCICYIAKESFAYANGTTEVMEEEAKVTWGGVLVNFGQRFKAQPFEQKKIAALVIPKI